MSIPVASWTHVKSRVKANPGMLRTVTVLVPLAKTITSLRFDVDWAAQNYLSRATELSTPILLFHGDADLQVPVETSDALAKARPDLVEYHRLPDVHHVRPWNTDPAAYEAIVKEFLSGLLQGSE